MEKASLKIADMNSYVESSPSTPILGTCALATCNAVILTNNEKYVLGHLSKEYQALLNDMYQRFLKSEKLEALIIPGYYKNIAQIRDISNYLQKLNINSKIIYLDNYLNKEYESIEFGYDTRTNKFIKIDYDLIFKEEQNHGRN